MHIVLFVCALGCGITRYVDGRGKARAAWPSAQRSAARCGARAPPGDVAVVHVLKTQNDAARVEASLLLTQRHGARLRAGAGAGHAGAGGASGGK